MLKRTTPMKRGQGLRRRTPLQRVKASRGEGLGHKVVMAIGGARPSVRKESSLLRSKKHRQNVAALGCLVTGQAAQACHVNFDKGAGLKVCDSLCFPLRPDLHHAHDQGGIPKHERPQLELRYVTETRALLMQKGQWNARIEMHFQRAIQPLMRAAAQESHV